MKTVWREVVKDHSYCGEPGGRSRDIVRTCDGQWGVHSSSWHVEVEYYPSLEIAMRKTDALMGS